MIGAGTVLTAAQVETLAEAGAALIVTPNTQPATIRRAVAKGILVCAGCATATEAFNAPGGRGAVAENFSLVGVWTGLYCRPEGGPAPGGAGAGGGRHHPGEPADYLAAGCAGAGLGSDLYRAGQSAAQTRQQARRYLAAGATRASRPAAGDRHRPGGCPAPA